MYQKLKQKGIHHVCLRVPDLQKTALFYRNAFDAELVAEWGTDGPGRPCLYFRFGNRRLSRNLWLPGSLRPGEMAACRYLDG